MVPAAVRKGFSCAGGFEGRLRRFPARAEIASEGDVPRGTSVLVDGMACRFRTMSDGRRQILSSSFPATSSTSMRSC